MGVDNGHFVETDAELRASATETYTGVSLVCNWMGRGGAVGLPGLFV